MFSFVLNYSTREFWDERVLLATYYTKSNFNILYLLKYKNLLICKMEKEKHLYFKTYGKRKTLIFKTYELLFLYVLSRVLLLA